MPSESNTITLCEEAKEFLKVKSESTAKIYSNGLRHFTSFFKKRHGHKDLSNFLDMLEENAKLPRKNKKRIAEIELVEFINSLKEQGLANNSIRSYIVSIQNFLKFYNFPVSARWLGNYPKLVPKKINRKHRWKLTEIKKFVDKAQTYRDKAIILALFQSGLGISDLCRLNYDDVRSQLEKGKLPLLLDLSRLKTGVRFKTCLGADAVHYLKNYLKTRSDLDDDKPLFTKWGSNDERITVGAIQQKFKEIAGELDFIQDNKEGLNPARPHSLRSAFRSRLTGKMDGDLIEFFMGHEIGEAKRAYINLPDDELRELYACFEQELSIEKTSKDVLAELMCKSSEVDKEYQKKIETMETTIINLGNLLNKHSSENKYLIEKVNTLSQQMESMQEFISIVKDDPELLEPYSDEQHRWLQKHSKKQSPSLKPVIITK